MKHILGTSEIKTISETEIKSVLAKYKDTKNYAEFYTKNLILTKQSIKESVNEDQLLIQTISNINELDKVTNILTKRLREWYAWYDPELIEQTQAHEKLIELILLEEKKMDSSMGAEFSKQDYAEMILLATQIKGLYALRKNHEKYLENLMKTYCPNVLELAGATIGAKLIELAKSLKRMALLPASTIQLLGAEKALFRHLKLKTKSPKYGVIFQHPLIQNAKRTERGKMARRLADKLSLCARLDYFKGEFKAKEYRKILEQ